MEGHTHKVRKRLPENCLLVLLGCLRGVEQLGGGFQGGVPLVFIYPLSED